MQKMVCIPIFLNLIEEISSEVKHLLGKRIYFICLPIRMKAGDWAPAQAIAYLLE